MELTLNVINNEDICEREYLEFCVIGVSLHSEIITDGGAQKELFRTGIFLRVTLK